MFEMSFLNRLKMDYKSFRGLKIFPGGGLLIGEKTFLAKSDQNRQNSAKSKSDQTLETPLQIDPWSLPRKNKDGGEFPDILSGSEPKCMEKIGMFFSLY